MADSRHNKNANVRKIYNFWHSRSILIGPRKIGSCLVTLLLVISSRVYGIEQQQHGASELELKIKWTDWANATKQRKNERREMTRDAV